MTKPAVIQVDHVYAHQPSAVWRALTDPALHARWWAAGDVRPIVGHRFDLDMGKWGKRPCEVLEVEPERLFRYRFGREGRYDPHLAARPRAQAPASRSRTKASTWTRR